MVVTSCKYNYLAAQHKATSPTRKPLHPILIHHNIYMTIITKSTCYHLIVLLIFCSCGNADPGKNKTLDTSTTQTLGKQETEIISSLNIGGTYSFGGNDENGSFGSLMVYPLTDSSALFYLDICRGAPTYNMGRLFGQMTIKENIGIYKSENYVDYLDCILKFKFTSRQIEVVTEPEHDDCGFGGYVYADYKYNLIDTSIPKYFINAENDTVLFNGLTVEKYNLLYE